MWYILGCIIYRTSSVYSCYEDGWARRIKVLSYQRYTFTGEKPLQFITNSLSLWLAIRFAISGYTKQYTDLRLKSLASMNYVSISWSGSARYSLYTLHTILSFNLYGKALLASLIMKYSVLNSPPDSTKTRAISKIHAVTEWYDKTRIFYCTDALFVIK